MGRVALGWLAVTLAVAGNARAAAPLRVFALDATGDPLDPATSWISLARSLPQAAGPAAEEPDAIRFVIAGDRDALPDVVAVASVGATGKPVDLLATVPVGEVACPRGAPAGATCRATPPVRASMDEIDRRHPAVVARSVVAAVGGRLDVLVAGARAASFAVGGPRLTSVGPIERLKLRVRARVVRDRAGGPAPFGADDRDAVRLVREQLEQVDAVWGQCGVRVADESFADVRVVDPPPPHLLAIGCGGALPASGGRARFRVDGRAVDVPIAGGLAPREVTRSVAAALIRAGFRAEVYDEARIDATALPSSSIRVLRADGRPAHVSTSDGTPVTTDATLAICLGALDVEAGLDHFVDADAVLGTADERALVDTFADRDRGTLNVLYVSAFRGGGRVGESFIASDRSALRGTVVVDRAGVRAGRVSFALAHEIGHVLLDVPGHADDYGGDRPWMLMDADAADGSAFGPRRLTTEECARAVRQSGPASPAPLLAPWPIARPR